MKTTISYFVAIVFLFFGAIIGNEARKQVSEHWKFNDTWQKKLDAREAAYEKEKAEWPKRRAQDSIATVRYCERVDSMIRELKEVTRQFNVLSRFPDNVTQKEYDEIMK